MKKTKKKERKKDERHYSMNMKIHQGLEENGQYFVDGISNVLKLRIEAILISQKILSPLDFVFHAMALNIRHVV